MRHIRSILVTGVAAGALAACGEQEKEPAPGQQAVSGKILERSVSDDMLPFDTVRSQPPLAEPDKSDGAASNQSSQKPASDSETDAPSEAAQSAESGESTTPDAD